jgi:hypothetical protein
MAREESEREDLLREATALVERIELLPRLAVEDVSKRPLSNAAVFAGFRADGAFSVFFGQDPVYQFNAVGELRRAYSGGMLFKASKGRLASLERVRTANEVQLVRRELSDADQTTLLQEVATRLAGLASLLESGDFDIAGQVPLENDVLGRLRVWLAANPAPVIAARPNA